MEQSEYIFSELGERLTSAKGIIFSDVDGVWLDENNNFSFPSEQSLNSIAMAQSYGYAFVLNSDTGGESLLRLSQDFGIKSDICIAENGSYIQYDNEIIMIQQPDPRDIMTQLRNRVLPLLSQAGVVWSGDATRAIRTDAISNNSPLFLVNTTRQCSVGIYARQTRMTVDQQLTDYLNEILRQTCCDISEVEVSQYPAIGSCLIKSKNRPTKAEAVARFLDIINYSGPCYMVGDTKADDMSTLQGRVVTCAVGNASDELKTQANMIENTYSLARSAESIITFITNS